MASKRRPLGLALQMPTAQEESYRVDEHGAFVHGQINIGAGGMVINGAPPAAPAAAASSSTSTGASLSQDEADQLRALRRDTKLEDLEFLEKLGEGNSSSVHRAHDHRLQRDFAVKRVNIYDKSHRHQIIKELHTLYKCDSPYLISFHGAFFKDGAISIALELMDVGSLSEVLSVEPCIEEPELAYFAHSILQGLDYLRKRHAIHRDIKPSNICLNSAAEAKLSDFGITTSLDSTMAAAMSFVGTSAYMSPERLLGQTYKYPSDIWAIGLVFLECALGKFPYDVSGVYLEMMQSICHGPSPSIPKQADGTYGKFTREFAHFIACCLCKEPEKRSTAEELLMHPWFRKIGQTQPRTKEQMMAWCARVKEKIQAKHKRQEAAENGIMDTSTNGPIHGGFAGLAVPGYNNTATEGANAASQQRNNIPANAGGSFYQVQPLQ